MKPMQELLDSLQRLDTARRFNAETDVLAPLEHEVDYIACLVRLRALRIAFNQLGLPDILPPNS